MSWEVALLVILGSFLLLLLTGLPISISFIFSNMIAAALIMGFTEGPKMMVLSMLSSLAIFSYLPIPLFILMGCLLFESGMAFKALDAISVLVGRVPLKYDILAITSGTYFGALIGSSMPSTALLTSTLLPKMKKSGYNKFLSYGPILASGGLAMVIPPTAVGVIYATASRISVGKFLIAALIPGICMAIGYIGVLIIYWYTHPKERPMEEEVRRYTIKEKLLALVKLIPISLLIFLVTGVFVLGIATPSEAAALGALGTFILLIANRDMTKKIFMSSMTSTIKISSMILLIVAGSTAFGQNLAFSGVIRGLSESIVHFSIPSWAMLALMFILITFLGAFIDQVAIIMVTVPIFAPIVSIYGWDPIWFGVMMLITLEIALTTPPFGLSFFIMKSFSSDENFIRTQDLYKAGLPFILSDFTIVLLISVIPGMALWLPSMLS